ncbi:MAG: nuclear transport factor 2 family protein [Saprospiraceae bacterium]|nr:nuclear transport factor 2 family protein [Saprospiraceae bacterium]
MNIKTCVDYMLKAFLIMSVLGCHSETQNKSLKQTPQDQIRKVLYDQQDAWNRGDIATFMEGYWKSPELRFSGSSGLTKGWANTLERYEKAYPDKSSMGKLEFEIMDFRILTEGVALMNGKYTLHRDEDQPSGYFTLVWEKRNGQWLITADHTS